MKSTDNLRRQHRELLRIGAEMVGLLAMEAAQRDVYKLRSLIAQMAGILNVHLAMEDGVMYPQLLRHPDPELRAIAKRFIDEMGGLKAAFTAYVEKWNVPRAIMDEPVTFARETKNLVDLLSRRIEREDRDLYPEVDAIAAGTPRTGNSVRPLAEQRE